MADFTDKVVMVTGASGGVGRVLCEHFGKLGAIVIALDKSPAVHELASERTECGEVDLSDHEQVARIVGKMTTRRGPVDVLVNNAAMSFERSLARTTPEGWQRTIAVDLNSVYFCTSAVLPAMKERGSGSIVMVSSVNGLTALGSPAYSAAKAGILSFTRSVAVEYGKYGIRANAVCPGTIRTRIWQDRLDRNPGLFDQLRKWYPLGRVAEPIEVAKAVAFLAGDDASIITGASLNVDGGLMAGNAVMASELTMENI